MKQDIEAELEKRMDSEYTSYRSAREAEIQNRLARFRYDRENELREQLEEQYDSKKTEWAERLELEFQSREAAARKAIMSEIDAGLRNERLTFETHLELLKEETALELEVNMEDRLEEFKQRKEEEVASQLERQLDKREEIMRNKALIEIRKREALIRAEIEAQLGLKQAEIRDRLQNLTTKMDNFKENAEIKMREAVEKQVQGEIDNDEEEYRTRQEEFRELQNLDTKAEKRQMWMQSISGQDRQQPMTLPDPSTLGARTTSLGATGGRPMRGILGGGANQEPATANIGLSGMRAPTSSAKPLIPTSPLIRPVKSPIGEAKPATATILPRPIKKLGTPDVTPNEEVAPEPMSNEINEVLEEQEPIQEDSTESVMEITKDQEFGTLRPITKTMIPQQQPKTNVAKLTPVKHMLEPEKKTQGSPPPKNFGKDKSSSDE